MANGRKGRQGRTNGRLTLRLQKIQGAHLLPILHFRVPSPRGSFPSSKSVCFCRLVQHLAMLLATQVLASFVLEEMVPTLNTGILAGRHSFGQGGGVRLGFESLDRLQIRMPGKHWHRDWSGGDCIRDGCDIEGEHWNPTLLLRLDQMTFLGWAHDTHTG